MSDPNLLPSVWDDLGPRWILSLVDRLLGIHNGCNDHEVHPIETVEPPVGR
jgi:hypothetical protein